MSFNTFAQMVEWLRERERSDFTTDVLVEGQRGSGKSNDTHLIMNQLDTAFDFGLHYVYDADDLARTTRLVRAAVAAHAAEGRPLPPHLRNVRRWFDEAKNLVYRRNAMTTVNKSLSTLLSQIREENGTRFWVSPDAGELEDFLTKDQCDLSLVAPHRGMLVGWRFWKNYHAPPGTRVGRWIKVFTRTGIPNMATARPERHALYRRHKMLGFERVSQLMTSRMMGEAPKKPAAPPRILLRDRIQEALRTQPKASNTAIARAVGARVSYVRDVRSTMDYERPKASAGGVA